MPELTPKVVEVIICTCEGEVLETAYIGRLATNELRLASRIIEILADRLHTADTEAEIRELFNRPEL